jgi:hypothetical protein
VHSTDTNIGIVRGQIVTSAGFVDSDRSVPDSDDHHCFVMRLPVLEVTTWQTCKSYLPAVRSDKEVFHQDIIASRRGRVARGDLSNARAEASVLKALTGLLQVREVLRSTLLHVLRSSFSCNTGLSCNPGRLGMFLRVPPVFAASNLFVVGTARERCA